MNEVGIAGLICAAIACGHATTGIIWVLPVLTEERLSGTPFGPASMTVGMIRATFHIVTVFLLALGGLLMTLAWAPATDPTTALLRWLAAMWLGATAVVFWVARHRLRHLLRMPVWSLFIVVAALCWKAST